MSRLLRETVGLLRRDVRARAVGTQRPDAPRRAAHDARQGQAADAARPSRSRRTSPRRAAVAERHAARAGDARTICRCARRPTRRALRRATRSRSWRCSKALEPVATLTAASVGLFDEKNTLKKQWTAQNGGPGEAAGDGGADGAARHLPPARRRGRRRRARRHDRLRAEGRSAARGSAQAEHAGARHAAAGRRLRAAPGLRRRADRHRRCSRSTASRRAAPSPWSSTSSQTAEGTPLATAQTTVVAGRHRGHADRVRRLQHRDAGARRLPDARRRHLDGKPVGKVVRTLRKSQ